MKIDDFALNEYKKNSETSAKNQIKTNNNSNQKNISNPALNILNSTQNSNFNNSSAAGFSDFNTKSFSESQNPNKTFSVSKEIRHNAKRGNEPLIHRPIFQKINTKLNQLEQENKLNRQLEKEAEIQARQAAKTGIWFQKKSLDSQDLKNATDNLFADGLIKVPQKSEKDSIYRRVAKFLVIIGLDEAAKIIPHLSEEQVEKIIPEIATIQKISPQEKDEILNEFNGLLEKSRTDGGFETAKNILTKAYGEKKAQEVLQKSIKAPLEKPFEYLSEADADRIKILLETESVAVKAIVLSQLEPKKAAAVLNKMDSEEKSEIILRLAKMKNVSPEVLERIDKSLHEKLLTQNTENSNNLDGRGILAQILKRMDISSEDKIIESLSESDPELGEDLRKRLFTEEDVLNSDNRFLQNKLASMDVKDIALLIKGKSLPFREKILTNVSKTRGDIILEEETLLGQVRKTDVEEITSKFYASLRRAWEDGELRIEGRDDGEVYV